MVYILTNNSKGTRQSQTRDAAQSVSRKRVAVTASGGTGNGSYAHTHTHSDPDSQGHSPAKAVESANAK